MNVQDYLEKKLNRKATINELENAKKDSNIVIEYILDEIKKIKEKLKI